MERVPVPTQHLPVTTTRAGRGPGGWEVRGRRLEGRGRFAAHGPAGAVWRNYCQPPITTRSRPGLDTLTMGEATGAAELERGHHRERWPAGAQATRARLGAIGWDQLPSYEVRERSTKSSRSGTNTGRSTVLRARKRGPAAQGSAGPGVGITTEVDFFPRLTQENARMRGTRRFVPRPPLPTSRRLCGGRVRLHPISEEAGSPRSHATEDRTRKRGPRTVNAVVRTGSRVHVIGHILASAPSGGALLTSGLLWLFPPHARRQTVERGFSWSSVARENGGGSNLVRHVGTRTASCPPG